MKNSFIRTPSYFWQDFLFDSIENSRDDLTIKIAQRVCDALRSHIERTNARLKAVNDNPTANEAQKQVQSERIVREARAKFEQILNTATASTSSEIAATEAEINQSISGADRIAVSTTMQKLNAMKPSERAGFLRRLAAARDWETLSHVVTRSAAFLEIEPEDYADIRQSYIEGAHPEKATRIKNLRLIHENYKKGFRTAIDDFSGYRNAAVEKAEKAQEAIHDTGDK